MHTNLRYEARKKSSKQIQESAAKKAPTKQASLTKEALSSQVIKRKGARVKMPSSKDVLAPHPHAYPPGLNQSAAKPKCTICNIRMGSSSISQQIQLQKFRGGKFSNKLNFQRYNLEMPPESNSLLHSVQHSAKKEQRFPQFFSQQVLTENLQSSSQSRMMTDSKQKPKR